MRGFLKLLLGLAVLAGATAAGWQPATAWWAARTRPKFDTLAAEKGDVIEVINSTGTIEPVQSVHVGAFVSGPIVGIQADFNGEVKEGDLLAEIDPRTYRAFVARDQAVLSSRRAELERGEARLQHARRDEDRALTLKDRNTNSISDAQVDEAQFNRVAMEAEIIMAKAAIEQAEANLDMSQANLDYTKILAPVSGIVIDRKVELGQTLAAQFQTPELFVIAPDMRREMRIFASVDEADIGKIRLAQESGKSVQFAVDAYPGEVFEGKIAQIRLASTTTQNVVTYPVVLSTPNPELKLLPGMTAEISFQVDRRDGVIKVPNAALRFYPIRDHVREADRAILDGTALEADDQARGEAPSATAKAEAEGERKRRHVWVVEADGLLRGIPVTSGIGDHRATEIVSGDVEPGQRLVVGVAPKDD
jgi:HlyD family secretion protein